MQFVLNANDIINEIGIINATYFVDISNMGLFLYWI